MMMSRLLLHSCTSIWRARGMSSILRISGFTMKSISAMQGRSLPKAEDCNPESDKKGIKMKQIKNAEYEEFQKYLHDKNNGCILTPDGLRFICQANDYDPEKIGRPMLEVLARQQGGQER